jgi:4-alpha-glucanotransferase
LGDDTGIEALIEAAYRFLARTPSRFLIVQIEDALLLTDAVNVPGTLDEHPNWRRRLPLPVDRIAASPVLLRLAADLKSMRPPF